MRNRYSAVHKKFFFWPNFCPGLLPNSFQPGCWLVRILFFATLEISRGPNGKYEFQAARKEIVSAIITVAKNGKLDNSLK